MEEKELIAGFVDKKADADRILFETYYQSMFCVAMRYLSNKEDAEDALTEAFVRIFRKIADFVYEGEGCLSKWIRTIVIRESLRIIAKNKRTIFREDMEDHVVASEPDFERNIDLEYVMALVHALPEGYRVVFNLYVIEQYSHKEISDTLGISISTSKSQLHKARHHLMKQLQKNKVHEMGRD